MTNVDDMAWIVAYSA